MIIGGVKIQKSSSDFKASALNSRGPDTSHPDSPSPPPVRITVFFPFYPLPPFPFAFVLLKWH